MRVGLCKSFKNKRYFKRFILSGQAVIGLDQCARKLGVRIGLHMLKQRLDHLTWRDIIALILVFKSECPPVWKGQEDVFSKFKPISLRLARSIFLRVLRHKKFQKNRIGLACIPFSDR